MIRYWTPPADEQLPLVPVQRPLIVLLTIRFLTSNLTSALKVDTPTRLFFLEASNTLTVERVVRGDIAVANLLRNPADSAPYRAEHIAISP